MSPSRKSGEHPLSPVFPSGVYGGWTDVPDSLLIPQFPVLSALEVIARYFNERGNICRDSVSFPVS
ncbi:hypothetical protein [Paenibacillus jamilae]|uniref:hypothetical protein n=1 Tax=Paenibacillus jamilae TaxID=114136 RepID=UPI001428C7B8|nr:hypothetical protein [Paenibacillus jamilae]